MAFKEQIPNSPTSPPPQKKRPDPRLRKTLIYSPPMPDLDNQGYHYK